jgi:hypothetical protein
MLGAVVSETTTLNAHAFVLPAASVAVHVTTVVPGANVLPLAGTHTTPGAGSHASVAVGVTNVTTFPAAFVHSTVMVPGQTIRGAVVSSTVIVWLHCALFNASSVASHVRVAVNPPGTLFVTVLTTVIATLASHASVAVGAVKSHALPHSTAAFGAHAIIGAVVSITLNITLTLLADPTSFETSTA